MLFLLDELLQGSRDTLLMLTSTDPHAALRLTASEQPEAYELALSLRAQLLSAIVEQSPNGYRVADARYLAGVIAFE